MSMELTDPRVQAISSGGGSADEGPDAVIQRLASHQRGIVARWQLLHSGVPAYIIQNRLHKGWLVRLHPGVYRVGSGIAVHSREIAALLVCGPGAALSHGSAARLWEIQPGEDDAPLEVSTLRDLRGRKRGIRVYRVSALPSDEVDQLDGLQLTTPSRTLLDLASREDTRGLEQAMAAADRRGLLNTEEVVRLLALYPNREGSASLRALLAGSADPVFARSEAEERFLRLIRKARLHPPRMNIRIHGFEVDALWERERLVVEIDGYAYHSSRVSFESDRRRDATLTAAGYRIMRISWQQLTREPEVLLVQLSQTLAASGRARRS